MTARPEADVSDLGYLPGDQVRIVSASGESLTGTVRHDARHWFVGSTVLRTPSGPTAAGLRARLQRQAGAPESLGRLLRPDQVHAGERVSFIAPNGDVVRDALVLTAARGIMASGLLLAGSDRAGWEPGVRRVQRVQARQH